MTKVVFVGDAPTKDNVDLSVPFVGTKSLKTLVDWIRVIQPDYYLTYNSWHQTDINTVYRLYSAGFKVVALGSTASKRLAEVPHFRLPHPSGLNRKNNDKEFLQTALDDCRSYVHNKNNKGDK